MYRPLILYLALVGALLALAAMTPAARGAAIVVPGADAVAVAKKSGGSGGKLDNAKDDDVTHVIRVRRAVRGDDIYARKAFAKDEGAVPKDRVKGKIGKGANRDDFKESLAKDDGKMRVDLVRRAVRDDVVHAKKALAKDANVEARVDRITGKSGEGANRDDLKKVLAKDDDVTHVDRFRRAIGHDEIYAKKAFAKDEGAAPKDRIKTGRIAGSIKADE